MSIFDETKATIEFCNSFRTEIRGRGARVGIDMRTSERLSSDALLLMRAIVSEARGLYSSFGGNMPEAGDVAAKFKQSGFFSGFNRPPKDLPAPQGVIQRKTSLVVDSEVAGELVQFAKDHADVSKPIANASYKNLVELMGNTHDHARGRNADALTPRARWHASVYCENDVAYFNFIDLGVGILYSTAPRNYLRTLGLKLFDYGHTRLLEDTFRGMIGASADVPGRGFGLQRMREAAGSGLLPELRVLTSGVLGKVATMEFTATPINFRGTVFRWTTRSDFQES